MKQVIGTLLACALFFISGFSLGWLARDNTPATLVEAGAGVLQGVTDTFHLERQIEANEKASEILQSRARRAELRYSERDREAIRYKIEASEHKADADRLQAKLDAAAAEQEPELEALPAKPVPEPCDPYVRAIGGLEYRLELAQNTIGKRNDEIASLTKTIKARELSIKEIQTAKALQTERAENAERLLGTIKKRSKRSLVASVAAMGAIAYFAAR